MSSNLPFALIVEDDPQVRQLLCQLLAAEAFEVSAVSNCRDAKRIVKDQKPDLVLLDLGLPGGDGLELGIWIRAAVPAAGIIILTGRAELGDRIIGLKSCADDYVTKPFDVQEVQARIHNLMRRMVVAPQPSPDRAAEIAFEGWVLGEDGGTLAAGGRTVKLTLMEHRLLRALLLHQGRVATREWLLDQIEADVDIGERTVDYHVCTLRIKLRKAGLRPDIIASVRGVGYKYAPPAESV